MLLVPTKQQLSIRFMDVIGNMQANDFIQKSIRKQTVIKIFREIKQQRKTMEHQTLIILN